MQKQTDALILEEVGGGNEARLGGGDRAGLPRAEGDGKSQDNAAQRNADRFGKVATRIEGNSRPLRAPQTSAEQEGVGVSPSGLRPAAFGMCGQTRGPSDKKDAWLLRSVLHHNALDLITLLQIAMLAVQ